MDSMGSGGVLRIRGSDSSLCGLLLVGVCKVSRDVSWPPPEEPEKRSVARKVLFVSVSYLMYVCTVLDNQGHKNGGHTVMGTFPGQRGTVHTWSVE